MGNKLTYISVYVIFVNLTNTHRNGGLTISGPRLAVKWGDHIYLTFCVLCFYFFVVFTVSYNETLVNKTSKGHRYDAWPLVHWTSVITLSSSSSLHCFALSLFHYLRSKTTFEKRYTRPCDQFLTVFPVWPEVILVALQVILLQSTLRASGSLQQRPIIPVSPFFFTVNVRVGRETQARHFTHMASHGCDWMLSDSGRGATSTDVNPINQHRYYSLGNRTSRRLLLFADDFPNNQTTPTQPASCRFPDYRLNVSAIRTKLSWGFGRLILQETHWCELGCMWIFGGREKEESNPNTLGLCTPDIIFRCENKWWKRKC